MPCWFLDLDTIWLRPCPAPSTSGHAFGSMHATLNHSFQGDSWQRYWRVKFLRAPMLQEWLSVPFLFPNGDSPVLAAVSGVVSKILSGRMHPSKVTYLKFMSTVKAALQKEVCSVPNGLINDALHLKVPFLFEVRLSLEGAGLGLSRSMGCVVLINPFAGASWRCATAVRFQPDSVLCWSANLQE